jgi:hypothetical protein
MSSDEMQRIEAVMRHDRKRYNKDTKMQSRYRELLEKSPGTMSRPPVGKPKPATSVRPASLRGG